MNYQQIGKKIEKIDAVSLSSGEAKFTADYPLKHPLHIAVLYSPHAFAEIISIDTTSAEKIEGVIDILHHGNTSGTLHTTAGQGYPEPSPYDMRLFDKKVRFVGDRVALVAANSKEIAQKAIQAIKVEYKILTPVFSTEEALEDISPKLHTDDEHAAIPVDYFPEKNIAAEIDACYGDVEKGFKDADFIEEYLHSTHQANHCPMEPHISSATFDEKGRLVIISSTQVPFHARRIVSKLTGLKIRDIRVIKPRIGGGFGIKQEIILEPLVALVAIRNKRDVLCAMSREEVFIAARTRHAMQTRIKIGYKKNGHITALEQHSVMNAGAYGSHALTVLSNAGGKVLPLFNKIDNIRFWGRSVYTNTLIGGAYRGYGATQSYFAINQILDDIACKLNLDILTYFKSQHIKVGETSPMFKALGEGTEGVEQVMNSCLLSECIDRGAAEIGWYEKRQKRITNGDSVKGMGAAIAMQGSGIPRIDMAAASMKMNEDGSFNLYVGATDIGTGSDTVLAQIAAETLTVTTKNIIVLSSDTDLTPFDVGAYASSTTYISGSAVKKCAELLKEQIFSVAAEMLNCQQEEITLEKGIASNKYNQVSLEEIGYYSTYTCNQFQIQASASSTVELSPPPFAATFAEVDVDISTGKIKIDRLVTVVDCGQAINPKLAEGQVEGAAVNGISFALTEQYLFNEKGAVTNPSFWDYKIYNIADIPPMKSIILDSYESSGPYGAKSVAEIAINGPAPAIANAIYDAVGIRINDLPITPEKILKTLRAKS
ncbi:MAG: molybdopterin-dependent oxidoreductase [Candidatus Cloacimonetes bacterium]|nr:molybdopterin-dependent oxidoreductase [Candidatus Cloacimonadota bacterium]